MGISVSDNSKEKIAIIGGGITGLFCAYILAKKVKSVRINLLK